MDAKEKCGLYGVFGVENASKLVYQGLYSLQHRGQESAGIVSSDGTKFTRYKGMGLAVADDGVVRGTTCRAHRHAFLAGGYAIPPERETHKFVLERT